MLYLIGLGLSSTDDITLSGLEAIKQCDKVYLESYTSLLMDAQPQDLAKKYGKPIFMQDRENVENEAHKLIEYAREHKVAFLVVGDPFGATTHTDLLLRCDQEHVKYEVIHNVSILNAVGACGISLYNFGQTVSIPFFTKTWKPASWMTKIVQNRTIGLHTLCLLDIKVREQSEENLARGRMIYEEPRYMRVSQAIQQIFEISCTEDTPLTSLGDPNQILAIGCCRVGSKTSKFVAGTLQQLSKKSEESYGPTLHSLIILGSQLNPIERDFCLKFVDEIERTNWIDVAKQYYNCHD